MKKLLKLFLIMLISITVYATLPSQKIGAVITPDNNGNWYWGYESELDEAYYSDLIGINYSDSEAFKEALHLIISTGCDVGSYADAKTSLAILDEDPNDPNSILCIYTGTSILKTNFASNSQTTYWNREHTWAKSYGFPDKSYDAHNDIHHLRACQMSANSRRNNRGFIDIESGDTDIYGSTISGSDWYEPRQEVKGDIARILMYMEVRYTGDSLSDGVKLTLTNDNTLSTSTGNGQLGKLDSLKKWHEEDPVDDLERQRNDKAYEIQGNRNPFVDHPEYANYIFGTNYEVEMDNDLTVTYQCDNTTTFNYVDPTNYQSGSLIAQPTIKPVKEGYAFIGWYTDEELTFEWDFTKSKIYYDLVLYPKFVEEVNPIDAFKALDIQAKLSVKATESSSGGVQTNTLNIASFEGDGSLSGKNKEIDLKDACDYNTALFDIIYKTNNNASGYIGGSGKQLRLYVGSGTTNGGSVEITAKNGLAITKVIYQTESHSKDTSSDLKVTISADGKTAILQNTNSGTSGHARIKSLTITYQEEVSSFEIEGIKLAYRYQIDTKLYGELIELDSNSIFGIEVNGIKHDLTIKNDMVYYQENIVIQLEYEVKGYVIIDGQTIYTESEIYDINSLADMYLTLLPTDETVVNNRDLLNYLKTVSCEIGG